jgi:hypothetical protein
MIELSLWLPGVALASGGPQRCIQLVPPTKGG